MVNTRNKKQPKTIGEEPTKTNQNVQQHTKKISLGAHNSQQNNLRRPALEDDILKFNPRLLPIRMAISMESPGGHLGGNFVHIGSKIFNYVLLLANIDGFAAHLQRNQLEMSLKYVKTKQNMNL